MTILSKLRLLVAGLVLQPAMALADAPGDAVAGAALVRDKCGRCHAVVDGGFRPHPEAPPFEAVARRYPPESLAEAFAEGVVVGHPDMPEFTLQPGELDSLIAYLETLR